jgi:hypothetical protein
VITRPFRYDVNVHFLSGCHSKIQVLASRMPKFSTWQITFGLKVAEQGDDVMVSVKINHSKLLYVHRRSVIEHNQPTDVGTCASNNYTMGSTTNSGLARSKSSSRQKRPTSAVCGSSRLIKDDSDNSDDSESGLTKRLKTKSFHSSPHRKMFACPYYKHNPSEYGTLRVCGGPGWEQIPRLKYCLFRPINVC